MKASDLLLMPMSRPVTMPLGSTARFGCGVEGERVQGRAGGGAGAGGGQWYGQGKSVVAGGRGCLRWRLGVPAGCCGRVCCVQATPLQCSAVRGGCGCRAGNRVRRLRWPEGHARGWLCGSITLLGALLLRTAYPAWRRLASSAAAAAPLARAGSAQTPVAL